MRDTSPEMVAHNSDHGGGRSGPRHDPPRNRGDLGLRKAYHNHISAMKRQMCIGCIGAVGVAVVLWWLDLTAPVYAWVGIG